MFIHLFILWRKECGGEYYFCSREFKRTMQALIINAASYYL